MANINSDRADVKYDKKNRPAYLAHYLYIIIIIIIIIWYLVLTMSNLFVYPISFHYCIIQPRQIQKWELLCHIRIYNKHWGCHLGERSRDVTHIPKQRISQIHGWYFLHRT